MSLQESEMKYWTHHFSSMVCAICGNGEFQLFYGNKPLGCEHRLSFIDFTCGKRLALCSEHYKELKEKKL